MFGEFKFEIRRKNKCLPRETTPRSQRMSLLVRLRLLCLTRLSATISLRMCLPLLNKKHHNYKRIERSRVKIKMLYKKYKIRFKNTQINDRHT